MWDDNIYYKCPIPRCTHGPLASSMVDQFTKGQLFLEIWQKWELKLPLNPLNPPTNSRKSILTLERPGGRNPPPLTENFIF